MKQIILFAVLTLFIVSCKRESSADVNQKRIFTQYELFYNANEDITYARDPLAARESAGAWVNGENEGDAQATVTIEAGATSLIMPANQMAKIGAGPGQIYIQRRFFPELTQPTEAGGSVHGVYRPKFKAVVFN